MKHTYIINPVAGDGKHVTPLIDRITSLYGKTGTPFDIYITRSPYDATRYVKEVCEKGEEVRFYACGGDGTLNEVANGLFGFSNAQLGVIPCGSGNDFIKNFHDDAALFCNLEYQYYAEPRKIDVIQSTDRISMNICSIGFDAKTAYNFTKFKKMPAVSGKLAYDLAVGYTLLGNLNSDILFTIDGREAIRKRILICVIANGIYYGGAYRAAPYAKLDDGLIDLVIANPVSRLKFLNFVNTYKQGKHIGNPQMKDIIQFERCKTIKAESDTPFAVNFDGESKKYNEITFEIVQSALAFCVPQKSENE